MRVSGLTVTGFKGIQHADLMDLHLQPFVVLTGQNGSGKTALLQALDLLTRAFAPEPRPELVRLGEEQAEVAMEFSLTDSQFEQVDRYHRSTYGKPVAQDERYRRVARIDKAGNVTFSGSPVAATVFDPAFRRGRSFPGVTLVHAERGRFPAPGGAWPDSNGQQSGGPLSLLTLADDLKSWLTALDYRSLLETRQGRPTDDYGDLARVFNEATGKQLLRPRAAEGFEDTCIEVELGGGRRHGLAGLSSGEAGLLGLLCPLYRSAVDGGVLLLDEPELHLHSVLQMALLRTVRELAPRTQTIIVTHAVKIVAAVTPAQVYEIRRSGPDQARRVADPSSHAAVVSEMGIDQADLLAKAGHLVVEGPQDNDYLCRLFPEEMERIHVTVAGGCKQVLSQHRLLANGPRSKHWICLIDRDLMSEVDLQQLQMAHPGLYIWPRRALESALLDPVLLAAVLKTVGRSVSLDEAEALLRDAVDCLMGDVVSDMLQAALAREFPLPRPAGKRSDQGLREFYAASEKAMRDRGNAVEAIRAHQEADLRMRWEKERFALVDPKKALGSLAGRLNLFRKTEDLTTALIARAAQDPSSTNSLHRQGQAVGQVSLPMLRCDRASHRRDSAQAIVAITSQAPVGGPFGGRLSWRRSAGPMLAPHELDAVPHRGRGRFSSPCHRAQASSNSWRATRPRL